MIKVFNSQLTIKNANFQNSLHNGIYLINSDFSTITDSVFENNTSTAIIISGSSPTINNCQFKNNDVGIEIINQASPTISNNIFSQNNYPIIMKSAYPVFNNNQTENNNLNGIRVEQESIFSQASAWTNDLPYILNAGLGDYPTVASGTTLTLEPGVVIKPSHKYYTVLLIEGNLLAQGATTTPIVFTSFKDDIYGGDTNNDNDKTMPAAGDWKNIKFVAGSSGNLNHIIFRYGSSQVLDIDSDASVILGSDIVYEP